LGDQFMMRRIRLEADRRQTGHRVADINFTTRNHGIECVCGWRIVSPHYTAQDIEAAFAMHRAEARAEALVEIRQEAGL
jgi:hypothetical protein